MPPAPPRDRRYVRLVLAAGVLTVAVGLAIEPRQLAQGEERYVIPPGTAARALAGESIEDVLPQTVRTAVGRPLVVENRDTTRHTFGPFALEPGQSWRRTFAAAGDVQVACSLYPSTGFTIAVAPPPVPAERTTALLAMWLALLTIATAAAVGWVGVATGLGVDVRRMPSSGAASDGPNMPADTLARAWSATKTAFGLLPALAATLVAVSALRLSRTAAWADIAAGRTMWLWALTVGLVLAAAWCGRRFAIEAPGDPIAGGSYGLAGTALGLAALGLAWTPLLGIGGALSAALATAGAGLLGVAPIARTLRVGGAIGARRLAWAVALPGAVLLAVALPARAATPPVQALLAAPKLAAALGLAWLARAVVRRGVAATAPVLPVASALAAIWSVAQLYGALLGHLNAVTLPNYGNPVPQSTASAARGAALWAAECAACHEPGDAAAFGARPDGALFQTITFGQRPPEGSPTPRPATSPQGSEGAMPSFKYRLDVFQRGDIVNYVRSIDSGGLTDP